MEMIYLQYIMLANKQEKKLYKLINPFFYNYTLTDDGIIQLLTLQLDIEQKKKFNKFSLI